LSCVIEIIENEVYNGNDNNDDVGSALSSSAWYIIELKNGKRSRAITKKKKNLLKKVE
jgi:hypothetical protein